MKTPKAAILALLLAVTLCSCTSYKDLDTLDLVSAQEVSRREKAQETAGTGTLPPPSEPAAPVV